MSFFLFGPANPESISTLDPRVFWSAPGLRGTLSLGFLGNLGALGCFGSFVFAILLAGAFDFPVDGSLTSLLGAFCFGSGGLHSSLSSSLLAVWEKELKTEKQ